MDVKTLVKIQMMIMMGSKILVMIVTLIMHLLVRQIGIQQLMALIMMMMDVKIACLRIWMMIMMEF